MDAALLRVSTEEQDEKRQRKAIREYCRDHNIIIPEEAWFIDKESRDQDFARVNFQRLMRLVEQGRVRRIIVEKFDRIGVQDKLEAFHYLYVFRKGNCRVISTVPSEGELDMSEPAKAMQVFFLADQSEREQKDKGQRTLSGKTLKALTERTPWQGGVPPYGFDKIVTDAAGRLLYGVHYLTVSPARCVQIFPCPDCKARNFLRPRCPACQRLERSRGNMPRKAKIELAYLVPSEDESRIETMRRIFDWYGNHAIGRNKTTQWANKHGLKMYGLDFTPKTLEKQLINPAYIGAFSWNKTKQGRFHEVVDSERGRIGELPLPPGGKRKRRMVRNDPAAWIVRPNAWDGIIEPELFDKVQRKVKERKTGVSLPRLAAAWLRGLLFCGGCGKPMTPRRNTVGGPIGYCCVSYQTAKQVGKTPDTCGYNFVFHDQAEKIILQRLKGIDLDLSGRDEAETIRNLCQVLGQKEDLLAEMVRKDLKYYADRIHEAFNLEGNPDSKLARLVARLNRAAEAIPLVIDVVTANATDGPTDLYVKNEATAECIPSHPWSRFMDSETAGDLIRDIEMTKSTVARQLLDQLQADFDTLTRAKAMTSTDREKKSLESQLFRLNERMEDFEDHLIPLAKRRADKMQEIQSLRDRIRDAKKIVEDGEPLRKAEAIRQVFAKVVLSFGREQRGKRIFSPLLPERTEFITSPFSTQNPGSSPARGP